MSFFLKTEPSQAKPSFSRVWLELSLSQAWSDPALSLNQSQAWAEPE